MFDAGLNLAGGSTAVVMFDTACPDGWTRFAELDGKVPRGVDSAGTGGNAPGATDGTDTHSHTWTASSYSADNSWRPSLATNLVINPSSSWPPYLNVVWCKKN